jgi:hypothetical protein
MLELGRGPLPHQFLLNDIESILPGPLETGAGCDPTALRARDKRQAMELRIVANHSN